jgi:hypothetical protein
LRGDAFPRARDLASATDHASVMVRRGTKNSARDERQSHRRAVRDALDAAPRERRCNASRASGLPTTTRSPSRTRRAPIAVRQR